MAVRVDRKTHTGASRYTPAIWILVGLALALSLFGLVVLMSAGQSFSSDSLFIFKRQLIWLAIAVSAGVVAAVVDIRLIRASTWWVFGGAILLLVAVLIPGVGLEINGARRWLDLRFMRLQPSEPAKLALILVLAAYLADNRRRINQFIRGFIVPMAIIGLVSGLIFLEPDYGTAALCGAVGFLLLFLGGARLLYLVPTLLSGVALFGLAVFLDPVRMRRITAFLDVEGNKSDGAYQLWQGMLAFGAGGWSGVGMGQGRQQLSFLPEAHTDFIFPIIGEEMGFFVTSGVVFCFLLFAVIVLIELRRAPDLYQFMLVAGSLFFLILQGLINMGVSTGLLPTKGMSLPFISYGGSNLLLMFVLVGLIVNCLRRWRKSVVPEPTDL